jgi:hypothetical protein
MDYDTIILDCAAEVRNFRGAVSELDMPAIDIHSAVRQIFDVVSRLTNFEDQLARLAFEMGQQDALFENVELDNNAQDRVIMAVVLLGRAIKNQLQYYHAYRHDQFPYSVRNIINDSTIVLQRVSIYDRTGPRYPGYHGFD